MVLLVISFHFYEVAAPARHICFAFIARTIPMSLLKTKLCQQWLPQFGVSSSSCKGSKLRHALLALLLS